MCWMVNKFMKWKYETKQSLSFLPFLNFLNIVEVLCTQFNYHRTLKTQENFLGFCFPLHEVYPEGIQPCNMKNRDIYWRRYKIQETLYVGQWHLSPLQSSHLGTSHSSTNHHHLSHCIFLNLTDGVKSLPFQRWF